MASEGEDWAEWMAAGCAGDEAAYRKLLAALTLRLRPFIRRNLSSAGLSTQDVEDVVQETLIAVHLKRHTWRTDAPFLPWLNAIVRYKIIDALRRRGSRQFVPIDALSETLAIEDDEPALSQRDLMKMASSLPERQKAVLMAIIVEGETASEAATRLDMTEGAVRVTLHRALGKLAREFGGRD